MSNVWSSPQSNMSQIQTSSSVADEQLESKKPVRIYSLFKSSIILDEMSINMHNPDEGDVRTNIVDNTGDKTIGAKTIGAVAPLIRINDRYYSGEEIQSFSITTSAFIPELKLMLQTPDKSILKENLIKDGDICSVFFQTAHGSIKSYRADYIVKYIHVYQADNTKQNDTRQLFITGELYIPELHNGTLTFSFPGTSRDAIIDVAKKLGLAFFFCDEENTRDAQIWYCTADGSSQQSSDDSPVIKYIQNVSAHAYKTFDAFYDCWIDPRYGISFININHMLGETGLDEVMDAAYQTNTIAELFAANTHDAGASASENERNPKLIPKLLSNCGGDESSLSGFYIKKYKTCSNYAITDNLGLDVNLNYDIKNTGVSQNYTNVNFKFSLVTNTDKLNNGFYILAGQGKNESYQQADNGDFIKQHSSISGGRISETMSDGDSDEIIYNNSNMTASGNTNKFYDVAEGHNLLNNTWLKKKTLEITLEGLNLQLMRGEKIPVIIMHQEGQNGLNSNQNDPLLGALEEDCCGMFIIQSMTWNYDIDEDGASLWTTKLTLSRREWPIPGWRSNVGAETEVKRVITIDNAANNEKTEMQSSSTTNDMLNPTFGLKQNIKDIYTLIYNTLNAHNKSIKLVSGRRWAADENNNKVEGPPSINEGGLYKFINAQGKISWFSSPTSRHIYGEAFDIINGSNTSLEDIVNTIINTPSILAAMIETKTYCAVETSRDDNGANVKHIHIGTVDPNDSSTISSKHKWWQAVINEKKTSSFQANNRNYNLNSML